jgi:hypothetical protein
VKRDLGWIASLLGVGGYFLFLNLTIPLYADDYWYSLSFGTTDHLESLTDVFVSQWRHYFEWGGRSVAHTIGQLALLGPLWVFRVFNAIVFVLLNALIAFHAARSGGQRPGWLLFLISTCLFWLAVPKLGETTIWLMGSANYLWNAVFILLFLLITTKTLEAERRKPLLVGSHVIFGLLAGWGYETTSLTGLIVAILLGTLLFARKIHQASSAPLARIQRLFHRLYLLVGGARKFGAVSDDRPGIGFNHHHIG